MTKQGTFISESRPISQRPRNTGELVIQNIAIDDAAEEKIIRKSIGADNSKILGSHLGGNNSIALSNMSLVKSNAAMRLISHDP